MTNTTKKIIGSWILTNSHAISLLSIDYGIDDVVTIQLPNGETEECAIMYDAGIEDESTAYIKTGEYKLYFDECIRL